MDNIYKPISRQEVIKALVMKFGAVEAARYFLNDALSDLQTMEVGVAENNALLTAKTCQSLSDSLSNLRAILEHKDYKGAIEGEVKRTLSQQ